MICLDSTCPASISDVKPVEPGYFEIVITWNCGLNVRLGHPSWLWLARWVRCHTPEDLNALHDRAITSEVISDMEEYL